MYVHRYSEPYSSIPLKKSSKLSAEEVLQWPLPLFPACPDKKSHRGTQLSLLLIR
ncbi:hypothetical protein NC653_037979 [Populus alba x Populus x berolinensis]|uniref:Uncharacterized protein n=1 Tax=Populus alba x Populus x berolinensis TaxID=444605 RepID=A0AAD6LFQ4_9ROSI|nr:hypothetical protein NC653_037979 [Populus alba x Populus x berolinensis]